MENELTCCVCLELFSQPLMLPCFHNFCRKCLEDLYRHSANIPEGAGDVERRRRSSRLRVLSCPKCRQQATLDSWKGISSLPENKALENIVSLFSSDNSGPDSFPKCRVHEGRKLCNYCQTCKRSVCGKCASEQHSGFSHNVGPLQQFIATEKDNLEANVREFDVVMNRIVLDQGEVSELLSDLEAKKKLAQLLVKEHFTAVSSCLQVQKMKLLGEIHDSILIQSKPILTLQAKYNTLTSEMRVLKETHQEVLREKNLAWKLKRLQDLSLRCSTFLTFRAGNIPTPPKAPLGDNMGDIDLSAILTAIRQLQFTQKDKKVAVAYQDIATQTDADPIKAENFTEKDDNMNIGGRTEAEQQPGHDPRHRPAEDQLGHNNLESLGSPPTSSSTATAEGSAIDCIQMQKPSQAIPYAVQAKSGTAMAQSPRDATSDVPGRFADQKPVVFSMRPNSHKIDEDLTQASQSLDNLTLEGEDQSNGTHVGNNQLNPRWNQESGILRSADDPGGQKFVFGGTQNSTWPTNLSQAKDLFGKDKIAALSNQEISLKNDSLSSSSTQERSQLRRTEMDNEGEERKLVLPQPATDMQPGCFPAPNSDPSPNVVTSAGQLCGIGARHKARPAQWATTLPDDKNMGAALKEGFNSAMCTLKSLCRVGMNVTSQPSPATSTSLSGSENTTQNPVKWPETTTQRQSSSPILGNTSASERCKRRGIDDWKTKSLVVSLDDEEESNCSAFGQGKTSGQQFEQPHASLMNFSFVNNGPGSKAWKLPSCDIKGPFIFNSVNGNSTACDKQSGAAADSPGLPDRTPTSNGLPGGGAALPARGRGDQKMSRDTGSPSTACDNNLPKRVLYEGESESEPDIFHTPEESFATPDGSPPLFSAPTFNIGTGSPVGRSKLRRHMMKKRR